MKYDIKEKRKRLHRDIILGAKGQVQEMLHELDNECVMLAMAKNERSRCSLHIAVLSQNEEILRLIAENFPTTLFVLDNVRKNNFILLNELMEIIKFFNTQSNQYFSKSPYWKIVLGLVN